MAMDDCGHLIHICVCNTEFHVKYMIFTVPYKILCNTLYYTLSYIVALQIFHSFSFKSKLTLQNKYRYNICAWLYLTYHKRPAAAGQSDKPLNSLNGLFVNNLNRSLQKCTKILSIYVCQFYTHEFIIWFFSSLIQINQNMKKAHDLQNKILQHHVKTSISFLNHWCNRFHLHQNITFSTSSPQDW